MGLKPTPDNTGLIPMDSMVLISPGEIEANDNVRLSLFLYQVVENIHLRNQGMQIIDSNKLKYPPLTLELYYMLTSYSALQNKTERTMEEHIILGRAMQVLSDNAIIGLSGSNEDLHITLNPISLDDMTKMWTTFQGKPFRPSICYVVTPVMIDSTRDKGIQRVVSKEIGHYYEIPEVKVK